MATIPWRGSSAAAACLAFMFGASAATAQTYKVRVRADLEGLDMKIEPVQHEGLLVIRLTNPLHQPRVRCDLRYDASPQTIYRKTTFVDPGKTEESTFSAKRQWFKVDVQVKCRPVTG
jgi:hypothetical protein